MGNVTTSMRRNAYPVLRVSDELNLPLDTTTGETFCAIGKRGTGKTNFGVCLVEEMVGAGLPVAVIDPTGVWWGLRLDKNGRDPGLDVIIFGGEHGDVPLEESAGSTIAEFIVDERRPCVLDLSGFRKGAAVRFMTDFAEELYKAKAKNRAPLHLVIDEADAYAPQRSMPETARCLGAIEDLVRRGRSRGLGLTLITQRPAVLNKNVMTQSEVLMAFQLTAPQDRAAVREWVHANADESQLKTFESDLATMQRGDCYAWSPSWLQIFKRVHIRERRTFDSSSTPKAGVHRVVPADLPPIDIDALRGRIAASIERSDAENPKKLRAKIAELEKQIASQKPVTVETITEVPVIPEPLKASILSLDEVFKPLQHAMGQMLALALEVISKQTEPQPVRRVGPPEAVQPRRETINQKATRVQNEKDGVELGRMHRAMLTALAQHPNGLTKKQILIFAGYRSSGPVSTAFADLNRYGLVEDGSKGLRITAEGKKRLGSYDPLPTGTELRKHILRTTSRMEQALLTEIFAAWPGSIAKGDILKKAGYASSGPVSSAFAKLVAINYAEQVGRGELRAAPELFDG